MAGKRIVPRSTASSPMYVTGSGTKNGNPVVSVTNRPPQFGVFFDGTGNNLDNDILDALDDKAPTNIAKLFLVYPRMPHAFLNKTYISGIGTEKGKSDSNWDMAFAESFGAKLSEGIANTQEFFDDFPGAPIGLLDVFGFSRGAATARAFVNEVNKINQTKPDFWRGPQLIVRFLGLFDTVGSIGMPGDNDNGPFILDLHQQAAEHVYHLTARHEKREYFPSSSILVGPNSPPATYFEEEELPGVHADVGGGYGPVPESIRYPTEHIAWLTLQDRDEKLAALKRQYEQKYAEPGISLAMKTLSERSHGPYRRAIIEPVWTRNVAPQLAHYALRKMHAKAISCGVPFEPLGQLLEQPAFQSRRPEEVFALPAELERLLVSDSMGRDALYRRYIHHSHKYVDGVINSNKEESAPDWPAPNGKREIFYNKPQRGYSRLDHWKRLVIRGGASRWVRQ